MKEILPSIERNTSFYSKVISFKLFYVIFKERIFCITFNRREVFLSMVRYNEKKQLTTYENTIKKSNELSMAKLNHGLTLNQMQLLAFAIFCTQQNGVTEFHKINFEKQFG